jgi:hypothetical protein
MRSWESEKWFLPFIFILRTIMEHSKHRMPDALFTEFRKIFLWVWVSIRKSYIRKFSNNTDKLLCTLMLELSYKTLNKISKLKRREIRTATDKYWDKLPHIFVKVTLDIPHSCLNELEAFNAKFSRKSVKAR